LQFLELQEQNNVYSKDLRAVKARIASLQRESRVNAVTSNQLQTLDQDVPLYRSVGKAFVFSTRKETEDRLEQEIGEITKAQRDLSDREEYLERRIASNTANLQDLLRD
jgi:prefoldin subunit 1